MRKKILIAIGMTVIGGAAGYSLARNNVKKAPELTPSDVAWALDTSIWKIDLRDAGEFYGVQLVVMDGQGESIYLCSKIWYDKPVALDKPYVVTIAARKDGSKLTGRFRHEQAGSNGTTNFKFDGFIDTHGSTWHNEPEFHNDAYWLASSNPAPRVGPLMLPPEEKGTTLALQIIRTPSPVASRSYGERPITPKSSKSEAASPSERQTSSPEN